VPRAPRAAGREDTGAPFKILPKIQETFRFSIR
jgi:hypothetical protein